MTRLPDDLHFDLPHEPGASEPEAMPVEEPRRAASLTLRTDRVREERIASMEAANKSLADALRVTYRLIQAVMVALVILFLFSGFQQVNESESAIRVEFGRVRGEQLEPGFQFSLPYPLGEIVKVETGNRTIELDDKFWPAMSAEQRRRPLAEVGSGANSLDPSKDGSLLLADGNIAHAQFTIVYGCAKPAEFLKNLAAEEFEAPLVKACVQRAAVQVAASLTIDDWLKPALEGGRGENSVESRIRRASQEMLDRIESGLEVHQVNMRSATPPLWVRRDFDQVAIAQTNAGKAREQALSDRAKTLNATAGTASEALLDLIDDYEAALELGDHARAEGLLAEIDRVLEGERNGVNVEIAGRTYSDIRISGEAARTITDAQQYRSTVVQRAQRQAETFRVKLAQYRANPAVFLSSALSEGLIAFLSLPAVEQSFVMPENVEVLDLRISPDPQVARERERARYTEDVEANPRVREFREATR